jgi:hypothetical protein
MAMAMAVPSRLWLGGVVSPKRDLAPITAVVRMVRSAARSLAIPVCVDGLASYVTAFARVFRDPVRTGCRGRPRLVATAGLLLGQVIKHHAGRCVSASPAGRCAGPQRRSPRRCRRPAPGPGSTPPTSSGSTPRSAVP